MGEAVPRQALAALVDQLREVRRGARGRVVAPVGDEALGELAGAMNEALDAVRQGAAGPTGEPTDGAPHSVLEDIIASVPHSIFWKDFDGRFRGSNQNLLNDLGLERLDQLVGRTDYDLGIPREQADFFRRCDLDVMESGRALLDIEEALDQADGTHTLLTSKVPLRDAAGRVNGLLGIYVDITERKRMEEALRVARDEAQAASRARGDFITVVSHELRTPLTLILGPLEGLLARADLPPDARGDLERMRRNAARLLSLVSDVLAFAATESTSHPLEWDLVDVVELVGGIVEDAQPAASRGGLTLTFAAEPGLERAPVDRARLDKIALNLIGNALKYTPPDGRVEVVLSLPSPSPSSSLEGAGAPTWELSVRDTGPGIPLDKQPLLFQRFQRLEPSAQRRHEGSGIGLALVKELAESMGGCVGVESAPGVGSRFFMRLPREVAAVRAEAMLTSVTPAATSATDGVALPIASGVASRDPFAHVQPMAPTRSSSGDGDHPLLSEAAASVGVVGERPLVLVVDDNADMRAWLESLLAPSFEVLAVEDGAAALAVMHARPPSLVISDVMMPAIDGLELVTRLRADPQLARVPVLMLTARADAGEVAALLDRGADDYVTKPFSPAELMARVRVALRLREATAALEREHFVLRGVHEELGRAQEQLVHSARIAAVGTLVAGLCHELNNPLSAILMNTQGLLARTPDADVLAHKSLAVIERHTRRCAQLVLGLLDFSRKKEPRRDPLDTTALLERVALLIGGRVKQRGVNLVLRPEGGAAVPVTACIAEIETALVNLVSNALDVTTAGGEVSLVASAVEMDDGRPGLELAVGDTGPGIPPDVLPHVFDPFFTTKPVGQGTGLGLSICHKIADDHEGRIDIDTGSGGTIVRLWLPASQGGRS